MARQLNRKKEIKESAKILSDNYEALHDFANAFSYGRLFKDYSDSLFDERLAKQAFALEARYEYERKEDSIRDEAVQKDLIRVQHDRTHTEQIVFAVVVIICLAIVAFILMRSRIASRKANELLTTKNQEIEQQKEAMEHQAVQLLLNNQQKDKLFSIIAHDLKGPLNSLKGLMDLLKENKLPESEIRSMMAELSRNVGHSSELVSNLLFWASSQLDGIVLNPVEIKVCQLVQDLLNLFVRQAEEKKIAFVNHIAPSVTAYADLDMTQVVLRNLIGNAIKFCRPGDTITLSSHTNNGVVDICVSDTGIGIKEELLEKIRRKESVTTYGTAKEKGTGLGMLLCREFAEANNGDFRIESQWGKGSQFYFTIPVAASSSSISV
jgi:signal transduction histidine kinase